MRSVDEARIAATAGLPVEDRRLECAGVTTAVLMGGEGPPVVLLHGPVANALHWRRVIPTLAETHRVGGAGPAGPGSNGRDREWDSGRRRGLARRARRADV